MKTTPSRGENMREEVSRLFEDKSLYCQQKWFHLTADTKGIILEIVSEMLQSHNNALVAEIKGMQEPVSMDYDHSRDTWFHGHADGFNQALDKVIRIIQEK